MTIAAAAAAAGSSSIATVGTIGTGTWEGTAIGLAYGGTGLVGATDGKIVIADGSGAPVLLDVGSSTAITTLGTVTTGTWQSSTAVIASAYLDADTAHLSTTQTFTGDKTFTGTVTVGVDDTGKDVKFFGASAGAYMEWDESADQLRIMGASADATTSTGKLLLATSLTDINANDVIGKIDFSAPHEAGGTDAIAVAASIQAVAQGTFAADLNSTDLLFLTGHSEAATEKIRITSQGEIGIGGANYGSDGQVLTSAGAGAAVAWESIAASGVTAMNSATENELVTVGATTTELDAEANLTFTGSALTVTGTATVTSTITAGGVVDVTDGSASAPAICNTGDTNTGILFPAADTIGMTTAGTERVRIGSDGEVLVNETANGNQAEGAMTLNQGANDAGILALKSSDVAHGVTDYAETDTYGEFLKANAPTGGLIVRGYDENANGLQLWGFYADDSSNSNLSAKTTAATAPVSVIVAKKSGTGVAQVPADENIFMIQSWGQSARFVVDEDGEIYSDGSHSTFDEYDDAQMLRAMDHSLDAPGLLMGKFDDMLEYNEDSLIEAGLLGGPRKGQPETERGLINYTGMVRLQSGAIWQLYTQQREMREVLENQVKELRDEILALREKN